MATTNTLSVMDGFFKEIYGDELVNTCSSTTICADMFKFSQKDRMGETYNVPVLLTNEHGVTAVSSTGGVVALKASVAGTMKNAQVAGSQRILRSALDYATINRSATSKSAFGDAVGAIVKNMVQSLQKERELEIIYGGSGLGKTSTGEATTSVTETVTMTAATWATGIWAGSEGKKINFYDGAAVVSSGADAIFTIVSIDIVAQKIVVSGSSTGCTALHSALITTGVALDIFGDGYYGVESLGLDKLISTQTGTVLGIASGTYANWRGSTYTITATLDLAEFLGAMALAAGRGLESDAVALMSLTRWNELQSELAAKRTYDVSFNKTKTTAGGEALEIFSANGMVACHPHRLIKANDTFIVPKNNVKRVGATDITFKTPGEDAGRIFFHLPDYNAVELRAMYDLGLIIETPAQCVKMS